MEELDVFVVGGGVAGAWVPGAWGGGIEFDLREQFFDCFILPCGGGCETRVGVGQLEEGYAAVGRGISHPIKVAVEGLEGKVTGRRGGMGASADAAWNARVSGVSRTPGIPMSAVMP